MARDELFDATSDDTEAALMAATYTALCEHGYADLTIEKIGDEFQKSTSLLYHHHDGKDDLLVSFLGYMLERFESDVPFEAVDDPWGELQGLLDHVLAPTLEAEQREFTRAMVELRAQAAHEEDFRAAFTSHDRFFHDRFSAVVREGVEQGVFGEVDPGAVASLVQTTFNGAMVQRVTTDVDGWDGSIEEVRRAFEAALGSWLLEADDRSVPDDVGGEEDGDDGGEEDGDDGGDDDGPDARDGCGDGGADGE
jgi:AcrR family transcriptional regulator